MGEVDESWALSLVSDALRTLRLTLIMTPMCGYAQSWCGCYAQNGRPVSIVRIVDPKHVPPLFNGVLSPHARYRLGHTMCFTNPSKVQPIFPAGLSPLNGMHCVSVGS